MASRVYSQITSDSTIYEFGDKRFGGYIRVEEETYLVKTSDVFPDYKKFESDVYAFGDSEYMRNITLIMTYCSPDVQKLISPYTLRDIPKQLFPELTILPDYFELVYGNNTKEALRNTGPLTVNTWRIDVTSDKAFTLATPVGYEAAKKFAKIASNTLNYFHLNFKIMDNLSKREIIVGTANHFYATLYLDQSVENPKERFFKLKVHHLTPEFSEFIKTPQFQRKDGIKVILTSEPVEKSADSYEVIFLLNVTAKSSTIAKNHPFSIDFGVIFFSHIRDVINSIVDAFVRTNTQVIQKELNSQIEEKAKGEYNYEYKYRIQYPHFDCQFCYDVRKSALWICFYKFDKIEVLKMYGQANRLGWSRLAEVCFRVLGQKSKTIDFTLENIKFPHNICHQIQFFFEEWLGKLND